MTSGPNTLACGASPAPGKAMATSCRCSSRQHPEHLDRVCERIATEPDGYCAQCHEYAKRESGNPPQTEDPAEQLPRRAPQ